MSICKQTSVQMVEEEGGMEYVSKERKWSRIATKLGLPTAKGQGSIVKMHYERVLYPYFLFKKGDTLVTEVSTAGCMYAYEIRENVALFQDVRKILRDILAVYYCGILKCTKFFIG